MSHAIPKKDDQGENVERVAHPEGENRRNEEVIQAQYGDDGDKDRWDERVRSGQQHDNNQVDKGGYTGSDLESKADEGQQRNGDASKQELRG